MTDWSVRRIRAEEWREYRAVRLRALRDAPDAFGSTYEDAKQYDDAHWQTRLADASPMTDLPLFAQQRDIPVGLAWGKFESADPGIAHVFQMWVAPEVRGLGIGRALVDALIAWSESNGAHSLVLSVTCGNSAARRLYESAGFEPIDEPKPMRPGSRLLEQDMVRRLSRRGGVG